MTPRKTRFGDGEHDQSARDQDGSFRGDAALCGSFRRVVIPGGVAVVDKENPAANFGIGREGASQTAGTAGRLPKVNIIFSLPMFRYQRMSNKNFKNRSLPTASADSVLRTTMRKPRFGDMESGQAGRDHDGSFRGKATLDGSFRGESGPGGVADIDGGNPVASFGIGGARASRTESTAGMLRKNNILYSISMASILAYV